MKITLNDVTSIDSITTINDNFDKIEQALQNQVLYRNNPSGEPNSVETPIDLNGMDLLNVGRIGTGEGSLATTEYLDSVVEDMEQLAIQVENNKNLSEDYKDTAFAAAVEADYIFDLFNATYLGVKGADPTLSNTGTPLQAGMMYFRTGAVPVMRVYNGVSWQDSASTSTSTTNTIDSALYANQVEAEGGSNNTKVMTPLRTKQAIDEQVKKGFTSTGAITLPGNAASNLQATPLQQVNSLISSAIASIPSSSQAGRLLRIVRFTSSGTFTKQAGEATVEAIVIGAGGGASDVNGSHGGGAGATAIKTIATSSLAASESVVVGQGVASYAGGQSSFAGVVAGGGTEGSQTLPGMGGTAIGGDRNIKGGSGGAAVPNGFLRISGYCVYGAGGNSSVGAGSPGFFVASSSTIKYDGEANTGAGGSGPGSKGGSGYVEIRTYS